MKVTELIKILQGVDGELKVVVPGYEWGYDPIGFTGIVRVRSSYEGEWWAGKYSTKEAVDMRDVMALGSERN